MNAYETLKDERLSRYFCLIDSSLNTRHNLQSVQQQFSQLAFITPQTFSMHMF